MEDVRTKRGTLSGELISYSVANANLQRFLAYGEIWELSVIQVAKISLEVNFKGEFNITWDTSRVDIHI